MVTAPGPTEEILLQAELGVSFHHCWWVWFQFKGITRVMQQPVSLPARGASLPKQFHTPWKSSGQLRSNTPRQSEIWNEIKGKTTALLVLSVFALEILPIKTWVETFRGWLLPISVQWGGLSRRSGVLSLDREELAVKKSWQDPKSEWFWDRCASINLMHSSGRKWIILYFGKGLYGMAEDCNAQEVHSKLMCCVLHKMALQLQWNKSTWHILRPEKQ